MNDSHTVATIGFEGAPVALCVTRQRVIAGCNRAFGGLFGYRVDELVGHSMALRWPKRPRRCWENTSFARSPWHIRRRSTTTTGA